MLQKNIAKTDLVNKMISYGFYFVFVLVIIVYSIMAPNFFKLQNFITILMHSIPLILIGSGLTFVIITGSLDISVGSVAFLSSAIGIVLSTQYHIGTFLTVCVILAVATICGIINGFLVVKAGINPLIITLGMMISLRGLALLVTRGNQWEVSESIKHFGTLSLGPVYLEVIVGLLILILVQLILSRHIFGKQVIAIGCHEHSALAVGIPTGRVKILVFVLSSFFAGIAGIFMISQTGSVQMHMGEGMEFTAIAAVIIGGTSLFGGTGSIIPGTMFGAIMLTLIENGLVYVNASPYVYPFVRGLIIFVAMYVDSFHSKKQQGSIG